MDLMDLLKLAGITVQAQPVSSEPSCGCGMGESEGAGFDEATTEPNPEEFPDGISTLGSVSDTSLRRYLKAKGDHVTVDENVYPDYAVEDVAESYKAFAEKAKNPYAVGMAQAMKSTSDEPPLKKSTIKKAHDIAKAVNEGSSNIGDAYMKHLHTKYNDKKSLSKSEAKEVKDMMTKHTIADVKKLASSGIRHVSDAAKDHIKRYVPGNMKKESLELDEAAKPDYIDIDGDGDKKEPMKKAAKDKEETKANESLNYLKKLAGISEQPLTPAQDKEARLMTLMPPEPVRDRSGNKRPTVPGQQSMNQIMKQQSKFSQSPVLRRQAAQAYVQNKSNPNWN